MARAMQHPESQNQRQSEEHVGLFGQIGVVHGSIQYLGLEGVDVKNTRTSGNNWVGALVGYVDDGEIKNCYALDTDPDIDIQDSSGEDTVGGLVGVQNSGSIILSYAAVDVHGGDGEDTVGGLVGWQVGRIVGSYATGDVNGGAGNDSVGGLVGVQSWGRIIAASYAVGDVYGGDGDDIVGGLVGEQAINGVIIASYAIGDANGDGGTNDEVGRLVGRDSSSPHIRDSYGFGTPDGETVEAVGAPPTGITSASGLTEGNAGVLWSATTYGSPWDFGTGSQAPALRVITEATVSSTDVYYTCVSAELPSGISCGDLFPGQGR